VTDDGRKIVEPWLPAERRPCFSAIGNDPSWVAGAAPGDVHLEIDARGPLDCFDHLEHRKAMAVAEVERQGGSAGAEVTQHVGMRAGKIGDMDVVADAGAIRRRVICAKNFELAAQAECRLHRHLDEMRGIPC
jgi:hypothetical protein